MEFFNVLKARHSIRAYSDTLVEEEKINRILEMVNFAPSAGNLQAFEIYLVTQADQHKRLVTAALGQDLIAQAPVVLVFCAHAARSVKKYGRRGEEIG